MHEGYACPTEPRTPASSGGKQGSQSPRGGSCGQAEDAGATRSTGPSQLTGEIVPDDPSGDPLPKDKVLRVKRDYPSLPSNTFLQILSFANATGLADVLNDLNDAIIMRCQGLETVLDSPYWVGG